MVQPEISLVPPAAPRHLTAWREAAALLLTVEVASSERASAAAASSRPPSSAAPCIIALGDEPA